MPCPTTLDFSTKPCGCTVLLSQSPPSEPGEKALHSGASCLVPPPWISLPNPVAVLYFSASLYLVNQVRKLSTVSVSCLDPPPWISLPNPVAVLYFSARLHSSLVNQVRTLPTVMCQHALPVASLQRLLSPTYHSLLHTFKEGLSRSEHCGCKNTLFFFFGGGGVRGICSFSFSGTVCDSLHA